MTQYRTAAAASLSLMTLTTMFLYPLATKAHQKQRFTQTEEMGTIFSILFWIIACVAHHIAQGEEIFGQLLTAEFVALNVGVGGQMLFAAKPASVRIWVLNSMWLAYATMAVVTFYSAEPAGEMEAVPPAEPKAVMLDLEEVEQRLEGIQARLERVRSAAKKQS